MTIRPSKERITELRRAFRGLVDVATLQRRLRSHPEYPTFIWPLQEGDDIWRELLQRAWEWPRTDDGLVADLELLRPREPNDRIQRSSAVYRTIETDESREYVVQVTSATTTKSGSVLGRVGAIEIFQSILSDTLAPQALEPITLTDVACLATGEDDPDLQNVWTHSKFLSRLDKGEFITQVILKEIASNLGFEISDLSFDHGQLYNAAPRKRGSTRRRRQVFASEQRERDSEAARRRLRSHRVVMSRLDPLSPAAASHVLRLAKHSRLRCETKLGSEPTHAEKQASIARFVANLQEAVERPRQSSVLLRALGELNAAGLEAFYGNYEDRVPLPPDSPDARVIPGLLARSYSQPVLMMVFQTVGTEPPSPVVDLSHTVGLTPTIEQLMDAELDHPT